MDETAASANFRRMVTGRNGLGVRLRSPVSSEPNPTLSGYGARRGAGIYGVSERAPAVAVAYAAVATASVAASAYHGYRRNDSVGWAIWWALMGGAFPVITPAIALAQGFGKQTYKTVRVA